jgi:hypothetical protein
MKTFFLMLASAFCGALMTVALAYGYFVWQFNHAESGRVSLPARHEKTVGAAPAISEEGRFHGTYGSYTGDFPNSARNTVLAPGPGKLTGKVLSGGQPAQGLRLRLALNGGVMSQWGTSGADGRYEIALPYGEYRIDGYELDSAVVNKVLGGKTDGPGNGPHGHYKVSVAEGKPGEALDFVFVEPVRVKAPSGEVSAELPLVISWEPYPGAVSYRLQLGEQASRRDYGTNSYVFDWNKRPIVNGTSANLAELGATLKKGHYYMVYVEALDERRRQLSQSPRHFDQPNFRIAP